MVADEVRNLAQRAAKAANETGDLIEQTVQRVRRGVALNKTSSESFAQIAQAAQEVAGLVSQIAKASVEQAQGVEQISTAVAQLDSVTQTNAASAEESASAAEELNAQSHAVEGIVAELTHLVTGVSGDTRVTANSPAQTLRAEEPRRARRKAASSPSHIEPAATCATVSDASAERLLPMADDGDGLESF